MDIGLVYQYLPLIMYVLNQSNVLIANKLFFFLMQLFYSVKTSNETIIDAPTPDLLITQNMLLFCVCQIRLLWLCWRKNLGERPSK